MDPFWPSLSTLSRPSSFEPHNDKSSSPINSPKKSLRRHLEQSSETNDEHNIDALTTLQLMQQPKSAAHKKKT
ncbi:unnamed protein product [Strongylus vulgaris]|uniref:Uncharacterized protein n=1 Tax=Strongylus vulgaris TaxID=40348 RepID=A0A3P7IM35_STRVU|nr:unnamed protein product [Strongylus vulgaris]